MNTKYFSLGISLSVFLILALSEAIAQSYAAYKIIPDASDIASNIYTIPPRSYKNNSRKKSLREGNRIKLLEEQSKIVLGNTSTSPNFNPGYIEKTEGKSLPSKKSRKKANDLMKDKTSLNQKYELEFINYNHGSHKQDFQTKKKHRKGKKKPKNSLKEDLESKKLSNYEKGLISFNQLKENRDSQLKISDVQKIKNERKNNNLKKRDLVI
ncbi:hypothetical protein AYI69_g2577 [Smittium culicis]|uniref:Uncharacterized protein n=1 Tax=Smittium culicis TaxID=133412 RepID=A0A1R1YM16_9FUNG|nr:hypothetical protein AYI69_g7608 [Smittium culicis]OMJ27961.1 hypothetical protein AYI69_g2577 [Smittium culicis]